MKYGTECDLIRLNVLKYHSAARPVPSGSASRTKSGDGCRQDIQRKPERRGGTLCTVSILVFLFGPYRDPCRMEWGDPISGYTALIYQFCRLSVENSKMWPPPRPSHGFDPPALPALGSLLRWACGAANYLGRYIRRTMRLNLGEHRTGVDINKGIQRLLQAGSVDEEVLFEEHSFFLSPGGYGGKCVSLVEKNVHEKENTNRRAKRLRHGQNLGCDTPLVRKSCWTKQWSSGNILKNLSCGHDQTRRGSALWATAAGTAPLAASL